MLATGVDAGTAWHYGDPIGEQRAALTGAILLDRSHRAILAVSGPDRLAWLHTLTSQFLLTLADGETTEALVLSGELEAWLGRELEATALWYHPTIEQLARFIAEES